MMYLTINGQFENSHGTLFLLPWLVDDEVNGKPKKLMCRAAAVCYSKLFLGGKKKRCFTQSVSLYTEDFYPLFEWSFLHYTLLSSGEDFQYDTNRLFGRSLT